MPWSPGRNLRQAKREGKVVVDISPPKPTSSFLIDKFSLPSQKVTTKKKGHSGKNFFIRGTFFVIERVGS